MNRFLIAGNWKMNGGPGATKELLGAFKKQINSSASVDVLVCPPAISITTAVQNLKGTGIAVGAQNVYFKDRGAYTGEISTGMLVEAGCSYVIIGHSERREYFGETDAIVNAKTKKVLAAGLHPIICIGESLDQRKKNMHKKMTKKQVHAALNDVDITAMKNIVFAYEPLWAIGTGETATPEQAQEMHHMIRAEITDLYDTQTAQKIRILYGGSMKPHNAASLLRQQDVDGGLVGGASLKADSFANIIEIAGNLIKE